MSDETGDVVVITVGDDVAVVAIDEPDTAPDVVYVPGTGVEGITEAELAAALEPYATRSYVDAAVATGGDVTGVQALIDATVAVHRGDPTPHPVYDDLPSLSLLFRNRLV